MDLAASIVSAARGALASLASSALALSPLEAVGVAALGGLAASLVTAGRVLLSDCDLATAAAARALPARAFERKTVWIVGASAGIGEALALELARRGASLVLSARRAERLERVAAACRAAGAPSAAVVPLDVTAGPAAAAAAVAAAWAAAPPAGVDFLVCNAGTSQRGLVGATPLSVTRELLELNVLGVTGLVTAALPRLVDRPGGAVVALTASVAGKVGAPTSASYSASKFALVGWADAARSELAQRGLSFVVVCPGPVASDIIGASLSDDGRPLPPQEKDGSRMSAARCARYYAAAMHARLPESWTAPQPILAFVYVGQYFRGLYFWAAGRVLGPSRVRAFKAGRTGYGSVTTFAGLVGGAAGGGDKAA